MHSVPLCISVPHLPLTCFTAGNRYFYKTYWTANTKCYLGTNYNRPNRCHANTVMRVTSLWFGLLTTQPCLLHLPNSCHGSHFLFSVRSP